MFASMHRSARFMGLLATAGVLATGCTEALEPAQLETQTQAIYYGSRTPSVVPLSAGEQAAIGFLADPYRNPFCSGTLIDRDVVVTAQHCTEGSGPESMQFGLGSPENPSALLQVESISEHPSRDVALLFLAEDAVSRVPATQPVPFLRQALSSSLLGQQVEAAGYGETHDGSTGRFFAALVLADMDTEYYMVDGQGQRGICFGDSGGPLLVNLGGSTVVAGVESHGDSSCVDQDFLTRLDAVADWIDSEAGGFSANPGNGDKPEGAPTGGTGDDKPESDPGQTPTGGGNDAPTGDGNGGGIVLGCSAAGSDAAAAGWLSLPLVALVAGAVRRRRAA